MTTRRRRSEVRSRASTIIASEDPQPQFTIAEDMDRIIIKLRSVATDMQQNGHGSDPSQSSRSRLLSILNAFIPVQFHSILKIITILLFIVAIPTFTNQIHLRPFHYKNTKIKIFQKRNNSSSNTNLHNKLNTQYFCDPHIDFDQWLSHSPTNTNYKLIQSHILMRHGNRIQCLADICWTQPQIQSFHCAYKVLNELIHPSSNLFEITPINSTNILPGNCLIGQLNQYGYDQCYNHGNLLRNRYIHRYQLLQQTLNTSTYDEIRNNIVLRADNGDNGRVLQSVMGLFQGLYPNTSNEYIIPIQTCDTKYDIILPNSNICPILSEMHKNIQNTEKYKLRQKTVTQQLIELTNNFTFIKNLKEDQTQDCGIVFGCYNYSVPQTFTQELFNNITMDRSWYQNYYNTYPNYINATKFQNGPLLKLIYERLQHAVNGTDDTKLYVYGGHDTGPIAPILGAFKHDIDFWIPYASMVSIELFRSQMENSYYVLLSYNGNILNVDDWCDSNDNEFDLCSWSKYDKWMKIVTPNKQDCPNLNL